MADPTLQSSGAGSWEAPLLLDSGSTLRHELGGLKLWITLLQKEWQVRFERQADSLDASGWQYQINAAVPGADATLSRYARSDDGREVIISPALADLPMAIRPYHPFHIPSGSETTLFISTICWLRVKVGSKQTQLLELPVVTPSFSWVGSSTMDGNVCYASHTFARLVLEALPIRPWRAITPVRIINHSREPLLLERFSLPSPMLALYRNTQGQLWTPSINVDSEGDLRNAKMTIADRAPGQAGACSMICEARTEPERGGLNKAFGLLFGRAQT